MSVEVLNGVRIVHCHAIMNVVIGVRVMELHAIIDVVIGIRAVLCHQAIDNSRFSTFSELSTYVQILILLSSCINSSSLFPVAILCTLSHRENTSFEVWYLQIQYHFFSEPGPVVCLGKIHQNPEYHEAWRKRIEWITSCHVEQERTSLESTPSLAELHRFAMNFLVRKRKKKNRNGKKRRK